MLDPLRHICEPAFDALLPPAGRVGLEGGDLAGWDLAGWVYQSPQESPSAGPAIRVRTDRNHVAEFGAHVWHSQSWGGRPRKLGFAVPVELLPPFSEKVFVTDPQDVPLRGGEIAIPRKPQAEADRPRHLIVHLPKTAGTSLRGFLDSNLRKSDFCATYGEHSEKISHPEFLALPEAQRRRFRVVIGHVHPSFSEYLLGDVRFVTFLRRPMDRIRSHVLHHLRNLGPEVDTFQGRMPLEQAVNDGSTEIADNLQLRILGQFKEFQVRELTPDHLRQVQDILRERFAFVGFAEEGDADIRRLGRLLGIDSRRVRRENVTPRTSPQKNADLLARIDWQRVAQRNALDEELYRWARIHFGAPHS